MHDVVAVRVTFSYPIHNDRDKSFSRFMGPFITAGPGRPRVLRPAWIGAAQYVRDALLLSGERRSAAVRGVSDRFARCAR